VSKSFVLEISIMPLKYPNQIHPHVDKFNETLKIG